jgi:hypothetical protein
MKNILLNNQEYLIFLAGVMISSGIIKAKNYFNPLFCLLLDKVKSKKLIVYLISFVSGVLPVSGRVSVSAGMLDAIAPKHNNKSRSKFGIIDYLATHHYYLWSPLEKTIIIPMSVFALSYLQVMQYLWPLLLVTLIYTLCYIKVMINEEDIEINKTTNLNKHNLSFALLPLLVGMGFLIGGYNPNIIFGLLSVYYIVYSKEFKFWKFINWNLIVLLFLVNCVANYISTYSSVLEVYAKNQNNILLTCVFGFLFSFLLGSSGKFIGMAVLLTKIFGMKYFILFFAIEYSGYLISPSHKCTCIGKMYFNTPILDYAKALLMWIVLMILTGLGVMILYGN